MPIKYADKIIKEIKERGPIKIPDNCATGEEFEKYLRRNKNFMTVNEIKDKLKSIQQPTTKVVGLQSPSGQNNQVE